MHTYRTVRYDWEIVQVDVDQYESEQLFIIVLNAYGSFEEAKAALPLYGKKKFPKWDNSNWIPLNPDHDYQKLNIRRKEVILKEWQE